MPYVADFETTTDPNDCRVWAYAICDIDDPEHVNVGISLEKFLEHCHWKLKNATVYFHNLKFDGGFIIDYLLKNGFTHTTKVEDKATNTFNTLISDKGMFYQIEVIFWKNGSYTKKVTFQDSLKILPMPVDKIAKAFKLEFQKLEIDYNEYRPIGHLLTKEEIAYIKNDVKIVAHALKYLFSQGMTKMTTASNALNEYKRIITPKNFERWFPIPDYDNDVRQSYKGGFTYLNPKFKEKEIGAGVVLDVNSLYPSVMYYEKLPYGEPIFFEGEYQKDDIYDVYIQMFTCQFEVKEDYIPTVQLKHNSFFSPTEYVTSSEDLEVTMCLTNVDLELFLEHYNVYNMVYHSGYKFKSAKGLFKDYIDKWSNAKIEAKKEGNGGLYTLSKLMLNSLYGKFATAPFVRSQIPYLDGDIVKYRYSDYEDKEPIYIPMASFITAYARNKTIRSAQKLYNIFCYADTDSLHLNLDLPNELKNLSNEELENLTTKDLIKAGVNFPEDFEIDPTLLGAWKIESHFHRAKFLRQKSYVEDSNLPCTWNNDSYDSKLLKITCAGMPAKCHKYVTFDNFRVGTTYTGKLQPKRVNGGVVLMDVDFTIKL